MSRNERLAQAKECLESEMTVKAWCAANGVSKNTMYVWIRRLREEQRFELEPTFVEATIRPSTEPPTHPAPIIARIGGVEMLVPQGASERDIQTVMRAAAAL